MLSEVSGCCVCECIAFGGSRVLLDQKRPSTLSKYVYCIIHSEVKSIDSIR